MQAPPRGDPPPTLGANANERGSGGGGGGGCGDETPTQTDERAVAEKGGSEGRADGRSVGGGESKR